MRSAILVPPRRRLGRSNWVPINVHFSKVRLHGFKSFVDSTELLIEPGVTGIVGPNGCGKSNVIEALRWVMGETSAKRMRGGEMDDVIFGGSGTRPQRNVAEVVLTLDNSTRSAPAAFNDVEELEIRRRIERGHGSSYSINGQDVRARDVQLLFADLASGANSTAIVSQGRVGAVIGAKPTERRTILEEAAGIRGLHSRRHEAELRLRAAESNLERLEDVIGALESQQQGLQRQVRQANRYRRIAEQLRSQEAILLHQRWTDAQRALEATKGRLSESEGEVARLTEIAAAASRRQVEAVAALPNLRKAEAEAAAGLQSLAIAKRQLEDEAERARNARAELETRLAQLADDIGREGALAKDANEAIERLTEERDRLLSEQNDEESRGAAIKANRDAADMAVTEKESELQELTDHVAGVEAQRAGLTRAIEDAEGRLARANDRLEALGVETEELTRRLSEAGDTVAAGEAVLEAETILADANERTESAEAELALADAAAVAARSRAQSEEAAIRQTEADARRDGERRAAEAKQLARERISEAEMVLSALSAEEAALARLLTESGDETSNPVLDQISVAPGYETALGAAMGEDLEAGLTEAASRRWRDLSGSEQPGSLPPECEPLDRHVAAPAALRRRLTSIGVVADAMTGERLQATLPRGVRLVSRDGGLWRWDGFVVRPGTETPAAARLAQRNRLAEVRAEKERAEANLTLVRETEERTVATTHDSVAGLLATAVEVRDRALTALQADSAATERARAAAQEVARSARENQQSAHTVLDLARRDLARLESDTAAIRSRLSSIEEERERLALEGKEANDRIVASRQALRILEDPNIARERLARVRASLAELRSRQIECRSAYDRLTREAQARSERLRGIEQEHASWSSRAEGATARRANLEERRAAAEAERVGLESRPAELEEKTRALLDRLHEAETKRSAAADSLAKAEVEQADADRALRGAEADLAAGRESRVRREAEVEQAVQASVVVADRIQEKLECAPGKALEAGGVDPEAPLPGVEEVETRIGRLTRERENIGAVNLRAEQESEELVQQIESLVSEREDLIAAINRLRHGIGALNREGRERLLAAFDKVDGFFQELFVRLFGGGEAKLALTEHDDPLQAGLEIMASPPGKKMQVLSLLSGGEQALTALALLFAVFQTNPAPICVLDEVDAPLDDANVDRFCTMVEEMAHGGETRFLLVTHHRMSMARVDRLFGVTMAERGVSQLVSVDLRQAERLREQAA